ncbi:hypothetical protein [Pseudomonas aeruginosa]|uniref:hypothetical protein n=1 Tax=Pseudomonas aeruginosa TaxID=287 RepID=UPI00128C2FD7|nr:hypothetical protein [Pseudomonas aeruginosa]
MSGDPPQEIDAETVDSPYVKSQQHRSIHIPADLATDTATWKTNFDAKASDFSLQALQKAGR